MSAVLIHRCRLRLVRRAGWSWGPDPRTLLQAAIRVLPALLAAALAGLWPEGEEREITAPVRLRLPLRVSDLLASHAAISGHGSPPPGGPAAEVAQRLGAALAGALAHELSLNAKSGEGPHPSAFELDADASPFAEQAGLGSAATAAADLSLRRLLRAWQDRGVLAARLALLSEATLEVWMKGLLREGVESEATVPSSSHQDAAAELSNFFSAESASAQVSLQGVADRAAALRAWLMSAIEASARQLDRARSIPSPLPSKSIPASRGRTASPTSALPIPAAAGSASAVSPVSVSRTDMLSAGTEEPRASGSRPSSVSPSARPMPCRDAEVHVVSALPFLLLGPLSRMGYLETLAATFAAADLLDELPAFAAALVFKALPPPERGWRRTAAALETAAACAGLGGSIPGEVFERLARRASPCLEPLAAVLADALIDGHQAGRPLLLAAAGDGLLLAEVDGVFPIAAASRFVELGPVLARLHDETLLIPADIVSPELLREIDASGLRFVTPVPSTRGEPWRPLRLPAGHRGERVWSNDPDAPGLARQAAGLAGATEGARRFWRALGIERPSLPTAADTVLDHHLTLAAGVALATLAWTLWREREPVDPILALERFGDLEARVHFSERSVRVLLPLGRRHGDLLAHRLLAPVRDAVWLGGRVLEFGGG